MLIQKLTMNQKVTQRVVKIENKILLIIMSIGVLLQLTFDKLLQEHGHGSQKIESAQKIHASRG